MTLQQHIEAETSEKVVSHWGTNSTFTPKICKETIGDGQHLIYVWTMANRPFYWLLLVDSSLQFTEYEPDVYFEGEYLLDMCYQIIGAEFGEYIPSATEEEFEEYSFEEFGEFETYTQFLEAHEVSSHYPYIDDRMGGGFASIVNMGKK